MKKQFLLLLLISIFILFPGCPSKDLWDNLFNSKEVYSVDAISNTLVQIIFNDTVEKTSAENPANYSINGLQVTAAARDAVNFKKVLLATASQQSVEYTLIITNVNIVKGNKTIPLDTTKSPDKFMGDALPGIVKAVPTSNTGVEITFSEALDPVSAGDIANYSITGGLTVLGAVYDSSTMTVRLTTSTQSLIEYTLTVSGVTDTTSNIIDPAKNSFVFTGYLFCVADVKAVNNAQVDVVFTNGVDLLSGENEFNYTIVGLVIGSAIRDSIDYRIVHLATASHDPASQVPNFYSLSVSGVMSVTGETILSNSFSFAGDALPRVASVTWLSYSKANVQFSEDVEAASAGNIANYAVAGSDSSTLNVISTAMVSPSIVEITTSDQSEGVVYTVTVNNVKDMTGNIIDTANNAGTFTGNGRPRVLNIVWHPNQIIDVVFSEDVEPTKAGTITNYSISDGTNVLVVQAAAVSLNIVHLTTDYQDNIAYTVTISNVTDLAGNPVNPNPATATFTGDASPTFNTVVKDGSAALLVSFSEPMLNDASIYSPNYNNNYILRDITFTPVDVTTLYFFDAYLDSIVKQNLHITLTSTLPSGSYELEINTAVQDASFNSLMLPNVRQFSVP